MALIASKSAIATEPREPLADFDASARPGVERLKRAWVHVRQRRERSLLAMCVAAGGS